MAAARGGGVRQRGMWRRGRVPIPRRMKGGGQWRGQQVGRGCGDNKGGDRGWGRQRAGAEAAGGKGAIEETAAQGDAPPLWVAAGVVALQVMAGQRQGRGLLEGRG